MPFRNSYVQIILVIYFCKSCFSVNDTHNRPRFVNSMLCIRLQTITQPMVPLLPADIMYVMSSCCTVPRSALRVVPLARETMLLLLSISAESYVRLHACMHGFLKSAFIQYERALRCSAWAICCNASWSFDSRRSRKHERHRHTMQRVKLKVFFCVLACVCVVALYYVFGLFLSFHIRLFRRTRARAVAFMREVVAWSVSIAGTFRQRRIAFWGRGLHEVGFMLFGVKHQLLFKIKID